jgi:hypothetical protein
MTNQRYSIWKTRDNQFDWRLTGWAYIMQHSTRLHGQELWPKSASFYDGESQIGMQTVNDMYHHCRVANVVTCTGETLSRQLWQWRNRARKQKYVREVGQRLAAFQLEARQTDIDYRIALQKLQGQKQHLKKLLGSLGFCDFSIEQYLQWADQDTVADRKVAIPMMERPADANLESNFEAVCSSSPQVMFSIPSEEEHSISKGSFSSSWPIPIGLATRSIKIVHHVFLHTFSPPKNRKSYTTCHDLDFCHCWLLAKGRTGNAYNVGNKTAII